MADAPAPRPGLIGQFDRFIGPGATPAEIGLMLVAALGGALFQVVYGVTSGWSAAQIIVAGLLAFDIAGGVVDNATRAARRWYHRPGMGFRQHYGFIAVHFLHPLLVVLLFRPGDWTFFLLVYGYLMLAALVLLRAPVYLRRPLALLLVMGGALLTLYGVTPTPGLEWLFVAFYLKLLLAHAVPSTP